jgi:hypothetical protein
MSLDSLKNARALLLSLPLGMNRPSVGAIPNGNVTLEWHDSATRTLTVAVSPDGDLHYAALLGGDSAYGTEPFFGEAPPTILALIARVFDR